jgi:hypothetical protein
MKKICFRKIPVSANRIERVFSSAKCFGAEFREFTSIFVPSSELFVGGRTGVKTTAQNTTGPNGRYPSINC